MAIDSTGTALYAPTTSGQQAIPSTPTYDLSQWGQSKVPTNPIVVSSSAASDDLNKINSTLTTAKTGIQTQATNVAAANTNKAATDAATATAAQDKAASDAKIAADKARADALSGNTPTGTTNSTTGTTGANTSPFNEPAAGTYGAVYTKDGAGGVSGSGGLIAYKNTDGSYTDANTGLKISDPSKSSALVGNTSVNGVNPNDPNSIAANAFSEAQKNYDRIQGIQSGTIPLTPGEQAQVDDLKNQFQRLIEQTRTANTNYQQGLEILGASSGRERYTPATHLGTVNDAINKGVQKIADLNVQMSAAIAKMEQGFKDDDINAIRSANDLLSTASKNRVDQLNKMASDASAALQQQFDNNEKLKKDNLDATIADNTKSYQEKQLAIQQSQLDEKTKDDVMKNLIAEQVANKGRYNRDTDGTIYDTATGKVVSGAGDSLPIGSATIGNTGNPLVDANTKYTSGGVPYVDGTNLTGAEATKAQLTAAKLGIPYIGKDAATAINNISAAKNDFTLISGLVDKLNPSVSVAGIWRLAVSTIHGAENITQSGPGATDIGSYNAFKESAIKAIQALAAGGTGLRINQAEIQTMLEIIPSYNDTKSVAQGKLAKLNAMLNNNEKGLIGQKYFDAYVPTEATKDVQAYSNASPEHQSQVTSLLQSNPNLTDAQIMQLVQP